LPDGELPEVKGGDDADKAFWMPVRDMYVAEPEWFSDHIHIATHLLARVEDYK